MIFMILLCYFQWIEKGSTMTVVPYHPKIGKLGYRYDIDNLPSPLLQIIWDFIPLHRNKMEDEHQRYK